MDHTKLLKDYIREVIMCSERWNLNYYLKLTEGASLRGAQSLKKLKEMVYDNSTTANFINFVNSTYQKLQPLVSTNNLKVSENMKTLISDAIRFLAEDIRNAEKLGEIENIDIIKDFAVLNIERLKRVLAII